MASCFEVLPDNGMDLIAVFAMCEIPCGRGQTQQQGIGAPSGLTSNAYTSANNQGILIEKSDTYSERADMRKAWDLSLQKERD